MSLSNENKPITPQPELPTDSPEFSIALIMIFNGMLVLNLRLNTVEFTPTGLKSFRAWYNRHVVLDPVVGKARG